MVDTTKDMFSSSIRRHVYWTLFQYPTNLKGLRSSLYGNRTKGGPVPARIQELLDADYIEEVEGMTTLYSYKFKDNWQGYHDGKWSSSVAVESRGGAKYYDISSKPLIDYFFEKNPPEDKESTYLLLKALMLMPEWRRHLLSPLMNKKEPQAITLDEVADAIRSEISRYVMHCFPVFREGKVPFLEGDTEVPTTLGNTVIARVMRMHGKTTAPDNTYPLLTNAISLCRQLRRFDVAERFLKVNAPKHAYMIIALELQLLRGENEYPLQAPTVSDPINIDDYLTERMKWELDNFFWVETDLLLQLQNFRFLLLLLKNIHPDVATMLSRRIYEKHQELMSKGKNPEYVKQLRAWMRVLDIEQPKYFVEAGFSGVAPSVSFRQPEPALDF